MNQHILISYNQASAYDLASKLNERFKLSYLKTWIDFEQIKGNIYQAMTEAVDNAFLVLVLVTKEYCESENCIRECSYAANHGKLIIPVRVNTSCNPTKTTGPVGLIISSLLYQDFSNPSNFEGSYKCLLDIIRKHEGVKICGKCGSETPKSKKHVEIDCIFHLMDVIESKDKQIEQLQNNIVEIEESKNGQIKVLKSVKIICDRPNGESYCLERFSDSKVRPRNREDNNADQIWDLIKISNGYILSCGNDYNCLEAFPREDVTRYTVYAANRDQILNLKNAGNGYYYIYCDTQNEQIKFMEMFPREDEVRWRDSNDTDDQKWRFYHI